jgi:predicted alpha/beta-hydrolase family hydrolase
MPEIARPVRMDADIAVASVWGLPDDYARSDRFCVILAHGAGNDMHHPFLSFVHAELTALGILCIKFNFPYKEFGRRAPDRPALLEKTWNAVIHSVRSDEALAPRRLYLGGKSMGGRVASIIAARGEPCDGLALLGYPLHPPKQESRRRVDHWPAIRCPALFVEGTRDPLCSLEILRQEIRKLPSESIVHEIVGGDHSFKLPLSSGRRQDEIWREIVRVVHAWVRR